MDYGDHVQKAKALAFRWALLAIWLNTCMRKIIIIISICLATKSHRRHFELKTKRHGELFKLIIHIILGDVSKFKQGNTSPNIFLPTTNSCLLPKTASPRILQSWSTLENRFDFWAESLTVVSPPPAIVWNMQSNYVLAAITCFVTVLSYSNFDVRSSSYELLKFYRFYRIICIHAYLVVKSWNKYCIHEVRFEITS